MRWGEFDLSELLEMRFLPDETYKYTAVKGDVLVCEGGYPGRAAIWDNDEPMYFQKALHRVRFHEPERNKWFVYYLRFRDLEGTLKNHFNGAGIQHFTGEALAQFQIPVPPLSEQQRIVGVLDEAFAGLATAQAHAERNLKNARALFESHLQSVFARSGEGWVETTIGDAFDTATGTTPPKANSSYYGNFIPFVKPPELCDGQLDSAADNLSEAGADVARTLPPRSILVSCIGNLGKVGLNTVTVAFNQQINAILPNEHKAIPELMFYQALCGSFKEQLETMAGGTTVPIVNKSKFNSVTITLPPMPEQRKIVSTLGALATETQSLESLYTQKGRCTDRIEEILAAPGL